MFTGIVQELGRVESVESSEEGARLGIAAELTAELKAGDSVAVNGACLTATSAEGGAFTADVMRQTLDLTTLAEPGDARAHDSRRPRTRRPRQRRVRRPRPLRPPPAVCRAGPVTLTRGCSERSEEQPV